jgi:type II secretory pathway pseudopilin PulG
MKNLKKCSFTIIELIVAMVVIGIAVASIPMLLSSVSQSSSTNLKSNSFYNAYSTLALIESMDLDENNTNNDNYYKVLTADNGDDELKCIRKGTKQLDNKSGADCATENNKTSSIGPDDGEIDSTDYDDIDDFDGYEVNTSDYNITVSVKYVEDKTDYSAKNIFYNDTSKASSDTNIKEIELKVYKVYNKKSELISIIRGKADNIGAVKIYSRNDL